MFISPLSSHCPGRTLVQDTLSSASCSCWLLPVGDKQAGKTEEVEKKPLRNHPEASPA